MLIISTVVQIDISWSNIADDDRILTAAQNILDRCQAAASAVGLLNRYVYQNYASYYYYYYYYYKLID